MDRNQMIAMLQAGEVNVNFTKVDGTERKMRCTLNAEYLPPGDYEADTSREVDLGSVTVWDIEADAWRRFRVESVHSATPQFLTE